MDDGASVCFFIGVTNVLVESALAIEIVMGMDINYLNK